MKCHHADCECNYNNCETCEVLCGDPKIDVDDLYDRLCNRIEDYEDGMTDEGSMYEALCWFKDNWQILIKSIKDGE